MSKNSNSAASSRKKTANAAHYFAGANTSSGFYNLFDQINDPSRQGFLYILKGGPGTGKSTLMKTVGKFFSERSEEVEYFYCSSDYQSLDGVRLPSHNIAIVDGTAPHVTEAQMPGVKDIIINLGEFIDSGLKLYEKDIAALLIKKKAYFDLAYSYIECASRLYRANYQLLEREQSKIRTSKAARKIIACLELDKQAQRPRQIGSIRRLFLDAIADDAVCSLEDKNKFSKIITLSYNCVVNDRILESIASSLTADGHDITVFCSVLSPATPSSIYIKSIDTLIKSESALGIGEQSIPTMPASNFAKTHFEFNQTEIGRLLGQASSALASAKKMHKKVESFYIPKMDFTSITEITNKLIEEIDSQLD